MDISKEIAIDYAVDFMRIVGTPKAFMEKTELIEINEYRGKLPCDWYETIQVKDTKPCICMRSSTDTFITSKIPPRSFGPTFMIQGDLIYTSMKEGVIEMSYRAIPMDCEQLPSIPDSAKYIRALESYIKKEWFTILFDTGKLAAPVLQNAQQEYSFRVGQAQADMMKLDLSKAESFFNSLRTLILRDSEFERGFINDGGKERLRVHT